MRGHRCRRRHQKLGIRRDPWAEITQNPNAWVSSFSVGISRSVSEPVGDTLRHECSINSQYSLHVHNKRVISEEQTPPAERNGVTKQQVFCNPRRPAWNVKRRATPCK